MKELLRRFGWFVHRRRIERELAEEMETHREMMGERGRNFGNPVALMEEAREAWLWTWLSHLFQDLSYAGRQMIRAPGFTAIAVLSIGLGIGANTIIFSLINTILLGSLGFREPGRLVMIEATPPGH